MNLRIFLWALALAAPAACATPICRWTDENGRLQASDVVPDQYTKVATCTDSAQYELSPEQQREAADRERERASRLRIPPQAAVPAGSARAADAVAGPAQKRPSQIITEATDCQTWMRAYAESNECFGPFKNTRGGMKPEAFDSCNVVPSPEPKCGPLRD